MTSARGLPEACPPEGLFAPDGTFFRLTQRNLQVGIAPPNDAWSLPVDKRGPDYQHFDQCDAYALSVFGDVDVLLRARVSVPWVMKKSIARLALTPEMGRILETPSALGPTHHDWWPSSGDLVPVAVVVEGSVA
jgi:hypothetical protein